jgi:S-adenosylmethionine:tRNA ribosyltransferase-isomerase
MTVLVGNEQQEANERRSANEQREANERLVANERGGVKERCDGTTALLAEGGSPTIRRIRWLLDFEIPPDLEADRPPEAPGSGRDGRDDVRLLIARRDDSALEHRHFRELPELLLRGDVVVVNTSATLPAAVAAQGPEGEALRLHVSGRVPGSGQFLVEVRATAGVASRPLPAAQRGWTLPLDGGGSARLLERAAPGGRLFLAAIDVPGSLAAHLARHGMPIRYPYVTSAWPLAAYQTVYATEAGSAEMPSAGRAFTPELITRLVTAGIDVAPVVLHTGVSSLEDHEPPYPEWYRVSFHTARRLNSARAAGGRIIAVGTTVVRALETVVDPVGELHPGEGWTEVVVTADRGVSAVDGLLTGWHEPRASHLGMLEAVAGRDLLARSYEAALAAGYRWHEFGDLHLILP